MTNVKSLLALYVKMGGSLTDTYSDIAGGIPVGQYSLISDAVLACSKKYSSGGGLPADFPAEGIANADKFLGFDENGDYAALDAPSGAEKFVVTLTADGSGAETVWTADKTVADIVAAYEAGQIVVAKYPVDNFYVELPISVANSIEGMSAALFCGFYSIDSSSPSIISVMCVNQGSEDVIQTQTTPIPTDSNAPLIVNMTIDQTDQTKLVGDKTFGEIATAIYGGKRAVIKVDIEGAAHGCSTIIDCFSIFEGGDITGYAITCSQYNNGTAELNMLSGSANEHPAVSIA